MKIKMNKLYGLENSVAYYRSIGDCFDFVSTIDLATELTEDEANEVMKYKDTYCKQYGASSMEVI